MKHPKKKVSSDSLADALQVAARYLEPRARFEAEVRQKLQSFQPQIVDQVIAQLTSRGILRDLRTAAEIRESQPRQSAAELQARLERRGAPPEAITEIVDQVDEASAIQSILVRRFRRETPENARAWRYLCSKGFDPEQSQEAVERFFLSDTPDP